MDISILRKDSKRINKIAIPLLITSLTNILFNIGDQAIIGRISVEGFTAISVVSNLLYALTGTLGIISVALNIIGADLMGKNDRKAYSDLFNTIITLSLWIGIGFELLCIILGRILLKNLYHMEGSMLTDGYTYLVICGTCLLLNTLMFIFSAYFKSIEDTSILFIASIISSIINIGVDYILVFGKFGLPRLGVAGAAIGSVVGLLVNVIIYIVKFNKLSDFKYSLMMKGKLIIKILRTYIPLLGQDLIESTGFAFVIMIIITRLGTIETGAYNLINIIMEIITLPIYAYGNALITVIAKSKEDTHCSFRSRAPLITISILVGLIFPLCIILKVFSNQAFSIITDKAELIKFASVSMLAAITIQLPFIVYQVYKYALNAIDDEKWVFYYQGIISVISLVTIYYCSANFNNGLVGLFVGQGINYLLLAVGFFFRYLRKSKTINISYS